MLFWEFDIICETASILYGGLWNQSHIKVNFEINTTPIQSHCLIDWLIEDILQAPSTMSGDLRA